MIGFLGSDPEIKKTKNGEFAILNLATNETYLSKEGDWKALITEWHKVVVFKVPLIEPIKTHLSKGDMVYVEGSIRTSKWVDGQNKAKSEIQIEVKSFDHVLRFNAAKKKEILESLEELENLEEQVGQNYNQLERLGMPETQETSPNSPNRGYSN